jgi:hypothetical protein
MAGREGVLASIPMGLVAACVTGVRLRGFNGLTKGARGHPFTPNIGGEGVQLHLAMSARVKSPGRRLPLHAMR